MHRFCSLLLIIVAASSLGACALTRSEVAVAQDVPQDPASGVTVVIASVSDQRTFEANPPSPSTPSLKEASQIGDMQITGRAIGRKRNTFGAAIGDVLLAPPQTVASLVGDAVKAGLRDAGYRAVNANDAANASAPRVTVRIVEFWNWVTPGFSSIRLDHSTRVVLEGGLPALRQPAIVNIEARQDYFAITESAWAPYVSLRLKELREKVRDTVAPRTSLVRRRASARVDG